MVNLSKLSDIEPINLTVDLTDPEILDVAVTSANETTGGYLGLAIGVTLYILMMYWSTREAEGFSLDFIKASVLSSGVTTILMLFLLGLDIIGSFIHLMWFVVIFLMSLLGSYFLKDKE